MELTDETRVMDLHRHLPPARDPRPYAVIARQRRQYSPPDPNLELPVPEFALAMYYETQRGVSAPWGGWGQGGAGDGGSGYGSNASWQDPEGGLWAPSGRKTRKLQEGRTMADLREMAEKGKLAWGCSLFRQEDALWLPLRKVR